MKLDKNKRLSIAKAQKIADSIIKMEGKSAEAKGKDKVDLAKIAQNLADRREKALSKEEEEKE